MKNIKRFEDFIKENYDLSGDDIDHYERNKELISSYLGRENHYTGSADWAGLDVWTIKGNKYIGIFVIIDENGDVVLLQRDSIIEDDDEHYEDNELEIVSENDIEGIKELLEKAKGMS